LTCARREFLAIGYEGASLRRISEKAKVTTGALYAHFKNKEGLFDALVGQVADEFLARYEEMHLQAETSPDGVLSTQTMKLSSDGMDWLLEYIYAHFDEFKLLFCCSEGTAYSGYIDKLIEIEEATTKRVLPAHVCDEIGDFFIHVICSSGLSEFFEMVMHDLPKEEAMQYMARIKQFRYGGWSAILQT
jgi:AcrR family transcriptional regulator